MTRKTGVPTLLDECSSLQQHITRFQPRLGSIYSGNTELIQALADVALCLVPLIKELGGVRELGD